MTRLTISPLTRVEGHGRVDLILRDGQLHDVEVRLIESPRLFEALLVGRRFDEVPDLICRICAICSAVHKLTALAAIEQALGIEVPRPARLLRELLLLGGHIQSHALHLFCLILPDFHRVASLLELLRAGQPLARAGLDLKAFGNQLQEITGGRVIHPVIPVVGGMLHRPTVQQLHSLRVEAAAWRDRWPSLMADFLAQSHYPPATPVVGIPLAVQPEEYFSLVGKQLAVGHGMTEETPAYAALLAEEVVGYSHAKMAAGPRGPFLTGALARLQLASAVCSDVPAPGSAAGIHDNNAAQLWEISWALKRTVALLDELLDVKPGAPLCAQPAQVRAGIGTAACEAPRGLLVHHFVVDEWGQVVAADIVTPTAINQRVIGLQILADLAGETDPEIMKATAERVVRSYDPCISCAVHLLRL